MREFVAPGVMNTSLALVQEVNLSRPPPGVVHQFIPTFVSRFGPVYKADPVSCTPIRHIRFLDRCTKPGSFTPTDFCGWMSCFLRRVPRRNPYEIHYSEWNLLLGRI